MSNDNVLEGVACPKCGYKDDFAVQGVTTFNPVTDDGASEFEGIEFPYPFHACCGKCGYDGNWAEFNGIKGWECSNCGNVGVDCSELLIDKELVEHCPDCCSTEINYLKRR